MAQVPHVFGGKNNPKKIKNQRVNSKIIEALRAVI
jgi:hypothetical protein